MHFLPIQINLYDYQLTQKNIRRQVIDLSSNHSDDNRAELNLWTKNSCIIRTITFDKVLSILVARGIRSALI